MRSTTLVLIALLAVALAGAAEVELARGGTVNGWVMVRSGWEKQPVVTVSAPTRQFQYDLQDVRRITIAPEEAKEGKTEKHVLAMKKTFIRKRADARSPAVSEVFPGFELKVLGESGTWLHVQGFAKKEQGYIPKDFTGPEVKFVIKTPQETGPAAAGQPSDATPPKSASPEQGKP